MNATKITKVNVYCDNEGGWHYASWSDDEHDHNGSIDAETKREAIAWAKENFPAASIHIL